MFTIPQWLVHYCFTNIIILTLWLFNIAMENGPFIDDLPIKNGGSFHGYVSLPEGKS